MQITRSANKLIGMMSLTQHVTQEIRAEAARQRLTQEELAARLRWTRGYLGRRLSGAVPWTTDDLDEVASALGLDARQLVTPRALAG